MQPNNEIRSRLLENAPLPDCLGTDHWREVFMALTEVMQQDVLTDTTCVDLLHAVFPKLQNWNMSTGHIIQTRIASELRKLSCTARETCCDALSALCVRLAQDGYSKEATTLVQFSRSLGGALNATAAETLMNDPLIAPNVRIEAWLCIAKGRDFRNSPPDSLRIVFKPPHRNCTELRS